MKFMTTTSKSTPSSSSNYSLRLLRSFKKRRRTKAWLFSKLTNSLMTVTPLLNRLYSKAKSRFMLTKMMSFTDKQSNFLCRLLRKGWHSKQRENSNSHHLKQLLNVNLSIYRKTKLERIHTEDPRQLQSRHDEIIIFRGQQGASNIQNQRYQTPI